MKDLVRQVVSLTCQAQVDQVLFALERLTAVVSVTQNTIQFRAQPIGLRWHLELNGDKQILVERIAPQERLRSVQAHLSNAAGQAIFLIAADASCAERAAREIRYDSDGRATEIISLDTTLQPTGEPELLNPPVPVRTARPGVRVALLDSGVNYLLPEVVGSLARAPDGTLLGYDYWDMDDRPFDVHSARSPFFVQRHGTRTASLILHEAPMVRLVPYRYPRPAMHRMAQLIEHAANQGVRIMAIPMGGTQRGQWQSFEESAKRYPQILFIASAGNDGNNIDERPVFPAALELDNLVVVTSADDYGRPAERENWGPKSVDLLIPAERQRVVDFNGDAVLASGSSYAVSRLAALAARKLSKNPHLNTTELKNALFAFAINGGLRDFVAVGYIPDPLADTAIVNLLKSSTLLEKNMRNAGDLALSLNVVLLSGSGWQATDVLPMVQTTADILSQCGVAITTARLHFLRVSPYLLDFHASSAKTIIDRTEFSAPSVYLVQDTGMRMPFEGEAFGHANTSSRPWLKNSVWLISGIKHPGNALAHELFHVLSDSGEHSVNEQNNLMHENTQHVNNRLTSKQCEQARQTGVAHGLVTPNS